MENDKYSILTRRTALAFTIRERPRARAFILKHGYRPLIENGKWDGYTVVDRDGKRASIFFSGELRKQMRKMLAEGAFDENT